SGDEIVGSETTVKVVKNKMAPPFAKASFDLMYGAGISFEGEVLDQAVTKGFVEKSGAWYAHNGERIGQGRDNAKEYLRNNPKMLKDLHQKVLEAYNIVEKSAATLKEEMLAAKAEEVKDEKTKAKKRSD